MCPLLTQSGHDADATSVQRYKKIGDILAAHLLGKQVRLLRPKRSRHTHRVSAFPDEVCTVPRSWAARAYSKLVYYNKLEQGGHFAAWEQPQLFSEEVRAGFRPLRKSN